jgi:hypothetical protein
MVAVAQAWNWESPAESNQLERQFNSLRETTGNIVPQRDLGVLRCWAAENETGNRGTETVEAKQAQRSGPRESKNVQGERPILWP